MKISMSFNLKKRILICVAATVISLTSILGTDMFIYAVEDIPEVDMNQMVEISILLEDESRFMEVDLYRIGEYIDSEFKYLSIYRELVDKDYYALDNKRQKDESVDIIAEYIKSSKDIKPEANIQIRNGEGKTKELPLGLYLIIQNDGDHNSELDKNLIVEAPLFDEEQNIYLYDIMLYPKWERSIWFSFRPEVVFPMEIVLLLVICVLLCIYSTRLIRSLGFLSIFLLAGLGGMLIGLSMTKEFIWLMVFFVVFAFLGAGIMWMVLGILGGLFKKSKVVDLIKKQMIWIIPILAGTSGGYIIYKYVVNDLWFFLVAPAVVTIIGEVIQFIRRDKDVVFHTYDNLIDLPILPIEEKGDNNDSSTNKSITKGE